MNPTTATLLRSLLKIGAGYLAGKGLMDEATGEVIIAGLIAAVSVAWGWKSAKTNSPARTAKPTPTTYPTILQMLIGTALAGFLFTGCASFSTRQTDVSYENGKPVRQITTSAQAQTLFEAKSSLANFKASQTDKTQGASVGSLNQESSGTATNAAAIAGAFLGTLVKSAK